MNRAATPILVLLLATAAASCADDGDDAGGDALADREAWCQVIGEVDDGFEVADAGDVDFEAQQAAYAGLTVQIERLQAGIDLVDAEVRDDVAAALDAVHGLTSAFVAFEDQAAAEAGASEVFLDYEEPSAEAVAWIDDECGVDIDS